MSSFRTKENVWLLWLSTNIIQRTQSSLILNHGQFNLIQINPNNILFTFQLIWVTIYQLQFVTDTRISCLWTCYNYTCFKFQLIWTTQRTSCWMALLLRSHWLMHSPVHHAHWCVSNSSCYARATQASGKCCFSWHAQVHCLSIWETNKLISAWKTNKNHWRLFWNIVSREPLTRTKSIYSSFCVHHKRMKVQRSRY